MKHQFEPLPSHLERIQGVCLVCGKLGANTIDECSGKAPEIRMCPHCGVDVLFTEIDLAKNEVVVRHAEPVCNWFIEYAMSDMDR